jgi:hypothetical protein
MCYQQDIKKTPTEMLDVKLVDDNFPFTVGNRDAMFCTMQNKT